jgi:hypothetical protein
MESMFKKYAILFACTIISSASFALTHEELSELGSDYMAYMQNIVTPKKKSGSAEIATKEIFAFPCRVILNNVDQTFRKLDTLKTHLASHYGDVENWPTEAETNVADDGKSIILRFSVPSTYGVSRTALFLECNEDKKITTMEFIANSANLSF